MKKQAELWMQYAEEDLLTIKEIIDNENLTKIVAFHAQQCVEKSFKALLELYDLTIPRVHDLRKLFGKIKEVKTQLEFDDERLDELNQIYLDTRYPSDFGTLPNGIPSNQKAVKF
jgi:HEPN domain-containing protein